MGINVTVRIVFVENFVNAVRRPGYSTNVMRLTRTASRAPFQQQYVLEHFICSQFPRLIS